MPKFSFHKHLDTLFLITHTSTFNISLQSLVLIQHLSSSLASQPDSSSPSSRSQSIVDRYYRALYSSLHDERLASSSKQTMYLNLLFKSLKIDGNTERVKSFVRRFIQILVSGGAGGTEFVVGGLYLLGEVSVTCIQPRWLMMTFTLTRFSAPFLVCVRSCKECQLPRKQKNMTPENETPSLQMHRLHRCTNLCVSFYGSPQRLTPSCFQLPLLHHHHPAISLHARQLLASQPITSSPDLALNTLSHFLDRFVYKNPKKPKTKGASAMQPSASAADGVAVKRVKGEVSGGALPNEEKFWKKKVEEIPVDEVRS